MKSVNLQACDGARLSALMQIADAAALIAAGAPLGIAGRAEALDQLPAGNWVGGTTPYFMTEAGGRIIGEDQVWVRDFSGLGAVRFAAYDVDHLEQITQEAPENGFSLTIIPFQSECHQRFAHDAATYPLAFLRPTVGWIAGFDLGQAGGKAYVYDGRTATRHADRAVVAHIELPADQMASVEIVNLFAPDGVDTIRFDTEGFAITHAIVNGARVPFADYVNARGMADGRLPLVGDYSGAYVNASIKRVDGETVHLYAPVFPGVDYAFAAPVADFAAAFRDRLDGVSQEGAAWSCNCILNFLYGDLEGKTIGGVAGPVTFGEIAYQLVNQTLVQVRVQ
ncbi:hypothetical protein GTZ99_04280 [Novosphingobium sp. FSY-8]|uniref:Uncharacterized protein n=1 Tax=Novosphingobium ovatum TaxID=1908523 RepID=A0ABW9XB60_9SPHN|nr:hypothetical protein [Novosphingobium ovatum]NBC35771.1 hypothetical protein [Novosphingobium ovatum]